MKLVQLAKSLRSEKDSVRFDQHPPLVTIIPFRGGSASLLFKGFKVELRDEANQPLKVPLPPPYAALRIFGFMTPFFGIALVIRWPI